MVVRRLVPTVSVIALAACSSLPDVRFDEDGGPGADGGCVVGGREICDDGMDNDCNGKTDCDDDVCKAGFTCVDAPPAGWAPVQLADDTRPTCPAGTSTVDLRVLQGDGTGPCTCGCQSVGGSCTSGTFAVTVATDPTCTTNATTRTVPIGVNACTNLSASLNVPTGAFAKVVPPTGPTTCTPIPAATLESGRACVPRSGGGCAATSVCVARTPVNMGLRTCIWKPGREATCPASYARIYHVGVNATEGRSCTGCTCTKVACGGSVSIYSDDQCDTNGAVRKVAQISASGACGAAAPDNNFAAIRFRSTSLGGCAASGGAGTIQGTVSFDDERTVCCK